MGRCCIRSDEEILKAFESTAKSYTKTGELLGMSPGHVHNRIRRMGAAPKFRPGAWYKAVQQIDVQDGIVIVGSDMHYGPGTPRTTAHSAMVRLCSELRPEVTIANGDVLDFPRIGKHPRIGWENRPTVEDEIKAGQERLAELAGKRRIWNIGNHDMRFEIYIAKVASDLAGVQGVHLKDHFPDWEPAWMTEINNGPGAVMVKHRWKGGPHAVYGNTVHAGRSVVTGHLHSAQVTCFTDYNGTRYGVDTGTIAVPYDEPFIHYTEANPVDWRSAVTVLTFYNGHLLLPEQLHVFDEGQRLTMFRGRVQQEAE